MSIVQNLQNLGILSYCKPAKLNIFQHLQSWLSTLNQGMLQGYWKVKMYRRGYPDKARSAKGTAHGEFRRGYCPLPPHNTLDGACGGRA